MKRTTAVMRSRWGSGLHLECSVMRGRWEPTAFEVEAKRLGLERSGLAKSQDLHCWAARWYRTRYVPEDLLKIWHLSVEE